MVADDPESFADLDGHTQGSPANTPCGYEDTERCNRANEQQAAGAQAAAQQPQEQKPLISVSVEGGFGVEGGYKLGVGEVKGGVAVKGEFEVSDEGTKISAKAEAEVKIGPIKYGVELEKVTKNEKGESEKATIKLLLPGVSNGKSEISGGKGELKIGVSAYDGPGAGASVTVRPGPTLVRLAIAVAGKVADAIL